MEINKVNLKVVLNHIEEKDFSNMHFIVYTLTDFNSGNNFDVWCRERVSFIDNMKLLIEPKTIGFELQVKKTGGFKLIPILEIKEAK